MPMLLADSFVLTIGTMSSALDIPTLVGLIFGLAGTFFVSIYYLRRRRLRAIGTK